MSAKPKYLFYPSLLQKYQSLLDSDLEFEGDFNRDPEGGYKLSDAEMEAKLTQELLDCINRVPHEPIEAADKGTCFNEIVDCLVHNHACQYEGMTLQSFREMGIIRATLNGFVFDFDLELCKAAAQYFEGSESQYLCKGTIDTRYGLVGLYGYIDELRADMVYDIKTTKNYQFGKFEHGWQKDLYPYCLIQSGDCTEIKSFEYTIFKLSGGSSRNPVISADMFREVYDYNHEKVTWKLRKMCESLIEWLEEHRDLITDKKVFGEFNWED